MATELRREECDRLLRDSGSGVLSLSDGSETYAVPESFGYDGERLFFQLVWDTDSKKMAFIETTELATFTAFREEPAESVIVQGKLGPVPEDGQVLAATAIAENAVLPTLNVSPKKSPKELTFEFYTLEPTSISGRAFDAFV